MAGLTMQVNIVAADHPVWHGTAKSVTILPLKAEWASCPTTSLY